MLPRLTLVLGGANSGKSRIAEDLIQATGLARFYIATAQAFDDEMRQKIKLHKNSRGENWTTIEAPHDLSGALSEPPTEAATLLDCITLWLSNRLLSEADLEAECATIIRALSDHPGPLVVVSNEVGLSIVPDTKLGRQFRTVQGRLNQQIASVADQVIFVAAGLPLVLKEPKP